jgi:DNA-binding CsgD family transcriptional regulator
MRVDVSKLGRDDLILLHELIDQSLAVTTSAGMSALLSRLCVHLPTNGAGTVIFRSTRNVHAKDADFVNVGLSAEWLTDYVRNEYFLVDPAKLRMFSGAECAAWSEALASPANATQKRFVARARECDMAGGFSVAARDASDGRLSLFGFSGSVLETTERHRTLLLYLAPHLHEAMRRWTSAERALSIGSRQKPAISARETEILCWAMAGKTNWEISAILKLSERAVKFHLHNVMRRLNASSRAHAVAIAMSEGLIPPRQVV